MKNSSLAMLLLAATMLPNAYAQFNGTIQGRVRDAQRAVIPNATVTLSGPALQGKKTAVSDAEGLYIFLGLPTGQMRLEAAVPGFDTYASPDIDLRAGNTVTIDIELRVSGVSSSVTVATEAPLVDITSPEEKFNVSGTFMNRLPLSTRQNWDAVWFMIPGAYTMGRTGPDLNIDPQIHGASQRSNVYKLDGIEMGNAFTNQGWTTQFSTEAIQDISIKTSAPDASTPLGEGGYLNVVTKSGGNQYHGSAAFFFQPRSFNWSNVPGGTPMDQELYQPDVSVGGPIQKDKTWFFLSYRRVYVNTGVARTATALANFAAYGFAKPSYDLSERNNRFLGKITRRFGDNNTVSFSYVTDNGLTLNSDSRDQSTQQAAINIHTGGPMYRGNWTYTITPRLLMNVQYGYRKINGNVDPLGGSNPSLVLYNSTTVSGGVPVGQQVLLYAGNRSGLASGSKDTRSQHEGDWSLSYVRDGWLGQHIFETGLQLKPRTQDMGTTFYAANPAEIDEVKHVAPDGSITFVPFHWVSRSPGVIPFGGTGRLFTLGGYLQDKWRPTSRLTLNIGMRFDNQSSHDLFNVNEINTVSVDPRLSVAYSLTKSRRDVIRVSWARIHDLVYVQGAPSFGNITATSTDTYSVALNGTVDTTRVTPGISARPTQFDSFLDPNLHAGYINEFSVGYTRQLPKQFVVEAAYVRRGFYDTLGSIDRNVIYQNGQFLGYQNPAFNALTVPANLTNSHQRYQDFEISVIRSAGKLMMFSSYTYQTEVDLGTFKYDDPNKYFSPSSWYNNDKLANPHIVRLVARYEMPWHFTVSTIFQLQSGNWGGPLIQTLPAADPAFGPPTLTLGNGRVVSNPLSTTTRLVGPRSQGQLQAPFVPRLNMRFGRIFRFSERQSLEADCDFVNITNDGTPLFFLNGTNTSLPTFGQYQSTTQSPRGAEISVNYRF